MKTQGMTDRQDLKSWIKSLSGTKSDEEEKGKGKPWTEKGLCLPFEVAPPRIERKERLSDR